MNLSDYPTAWQRKTLWSAVTALAMVLIGAIAVGLIYLTSRVLGFLQPILIPFAVAGVMAYLLDPAVERLQRWGKKWGVTRQAAVIAVFGVVTIALVGVLLWVVPAISHQTHNIVRKVPRYTDRVKIMVIDFAQTVQAKTGLKLFPPTEAEVEAEEKSLGEPKPDTGVAVDAPASPTVDSVAPVVVPTVPSGPSMPVTPAVITPPATGPPASPATEVAKDETAAIAKPSDPQLDWQQIISGRWVQTTLPVVFKNMWNFVTSSVGGFLGVFGFLLSMIIVPVYLWYFLIESPNIAKSWGDYVPLTKSAFKDEVVSALGEINGYLIAFFRGQLVVSLINGTATGLGLVIVGLDFGVLIGLLLCVLGIIPYLGIILCWVPAVVIASVQGGYGTWIPGDPWWVFPLVVTGIFVVVQQVDGLFITPKIVGESVGLHPMTVIVSVFVWSLLMGGLLGAILAVPLTATLKVLLRRYVWEKRLRAEARLVTEDTAAMELAEPLVSQPVHGK
ncbi:MAG TPA: AI-2E family transporter [Chthoniobacteraceae bacterium]|nr:AI-2E family transporter [Chthoniobacteraceae bacterium]